MSVNFGNAYARAELRKRMQHTFQSEQRALEVLTSRDDNETRLALSNAVAAKLLEQNLHLNIYLDCFDPRDRVFAKYLDFKVKLITPTYKTSVSNVY
jgi:hypothetical protein